MASAISLSFPSPAGDFFMFKKTNTAVKSPNKPKPIGKKALEIIKVSSLFNCLFTDSELVTIIVVLHLGHILYLYHDVLSKDVITSQKLKC